MDMKLKQMTPREYRKLVDDICDSMIEDELELLTVASADIEVKGKKAFLVIITESADLSDGTIKEIESKFE